MYGVMREHARHQTTQIAGLAVSAAATVAAVNLLMGGFGNFVCTPKSAAPTTIAPEKETQPPPPDSDRPEDEFMLSSTRFAHPMTS